VRDLRSSAAWTLDRPAPKSLAIAGTPESGRGGRRPPRSWAGVPIDIDDVRARVKTEVSSYKVPRHMIVITDDEVPWLVSQKADRRALKRLAATLVP
jgi:acyl-CoA synthetase (AMP-forming)/AMP-acid ligase II